MLNSEKTGYTTLDGQEIKVDSASSNQVSPVTECVVSILNEAEKLT